MWLRYLEAHDSVSRKEVAELCAISTSQAYRLLKKMERKGVSAGLAPWEGMFAMKKHPEQHAVQKCTVEAGYHRPF